MTKTKTKIEPRLSKDEQARLTVLKEKRLYTHVGFNVVRHFFADKKDADDFLALIVKNGADAPVFYGAQCAFKVERSVDCWEVAEG